jgi:hypothetical protein
VPALRFPQRNRHTDPGSVGDELFRAPDLDGQGNRERGNRKIRRGQILAIRRPGQRPDRGGIFGEGVERATGDHVPHFDVMSGRGNILPIGRPGQGRRTPALMRPRMRSEQLTSEGIDHPDL